MKIGFISILGMRGQWYVTQNFMRALQDEHELFLLARPFNVRDGWQISDLKEFDVKTEVQYLASYKIQLDVVKNWIKKNKIEVVFFNEEYDWELVETVKEYCKIVTYLDYFTKNWIPLFKCYDKIIICAKHAYNVFKDFENAVFIDWGVDTELFKPNENKNKYTFFHSAGWGGINWRKCSPEILKAFDELSKEYDFTLAFHSQTDIRFYDEESKKILNNNDKIKKHFGTVKHPGLYYTGIINLAVSKLEGLGLYIPEGLACGMPTITTDAPPMNQFVENGVNGLLVDTKDPHYRKDPYYFPEYEIDIESLKNAMITLGSDKKMQERMSIEARKQIIETNSIEKFNKNVQNIFSSL